MFIFINDAFKIKPEERIVNGIPSTTMDWPWIVSLRREGTDYDDHFCGGSIIRRFKPAAILTAAHCIDWIDKKLKGMTIWIDIGRDDVSFENDTERIMHDDTVYDSYKMRNYVYHPDISYDAFSQNTAINDVGLIFIDNELPSTQNIVTLNNNIEWIQNGDEFIVIGYGYNEWMGVLTDTLQQTDLQFVNDTQCNIGFDKYFVENWTVQNYTLFLDSIGVEYGNMDKYPYNILQCKECVLCAMGNNTDSCNGDSGSPLIKTDNNGHPIQVGIVSFGFECNVESVPAADTDIAYYYDWIQQELINSFDYKDGADSFILQSWSSSAFVLTVIVFIGL